MPSFIVLENPKVWKLHVPGAVVVSAKDYLTNSRYHEMRRVKVFNLCRGYGYQSLGYYVSLLAAARGHKPLPSVSTLQDLREAAVIRIASDDLEQEIQRTLAPLNTDAFELSIYFGRNTAQRYDRLAHALFNMFPAPLLRAEFRRRRKSWALVKLSAIAAGEIPQNHEGFVGEQAKRYFARPREPKAAPATRYDLAILFNPNEPNPPSDVRALKCMADAARALGMSTQLIQREDYGRIGEFDGLFIRETTRVPHHTYRFARRAAAEGMVVIDDPVSILRCTNKVFLAEIFNRHGIPAPPTWILHEGASLPSELTYPCVVKQPDSAFSLGVTRANDPAELDKALEEVFSTSELAVVQAFVRSDFDWRIGVLGGAPLFCCRYHFAKGDWRIQTTTPQGRITYGKVETLPLGRAPADAVGLAVRACQLVGDGLYGVDIKQTDTGFMVMEVNDNPNLNHDIEDNVLGDLLYQRIMEYFWNRLETRGRPSPS